MTDMPEWLTWTILAISVALLYAASVRLRKAVKFWTGPTLLSTWRGQCRLHIPPTSSSIRVAYRRRRRSCIRASATTSYSEIRQQLQGHSMSERAEMVERVARWLRPDAFVFGSEAAELRPEAYRRARECIALMRELPSEPGTNFTAGLYSRANIEAFIEDALE